MSIVVLWLLLKSDFDHELLTHKLNEVKFANGKEQMFISSLIE